jgi:hypothetical protein
MQGEQKTRTNQQNNSLHLLFAQISQECMDKGIEMREIIRDEVPIPCTPENIKWMWKLLQKGMFGTKSTTELKKTGQIEQVYDAFNSILIERTQGQVSLPPWPSIESLENK